MTRFVRGEGPSIPPRISIARKLIDAWLEGEQWGNVELLTFGGGESMYRRASYRMGFLARCSEVFDAVLDLTDRDLHRHHTEFVARHEEILRPSVRGYGYWIWKPYLIGDRLRRRETEFVVYVDAGCLMNAASDASRVRLADYLEIAREHGLCVMHMELEERTWCKADTLDRIGVSDDLRTAGQLTAGFVVAHGASTTRDLVDEWLAVCTEHDYRYVDDSPSSSPNDPSFVEHRHDQAVLSCLAKVAGIPSIPDETWFAPDWDERGRDYPFWACRDFDLGFGE